jgi:hypothetical protein
MYTIGYISSSPFFSILASFFVSVIFTATRGVAVFGQLLYSSSVDGTTADRQR